jgi:DNA-binding NarL/FixJ family response regulator
MAPPLVVIESANPDADAHVRRALARAREAGLQPTAGWLASGGRFVCHGQVGSEADAVQALRAAVGGSGVVITATAPRETIDRLLDDLRRLGTVTHITADVRPPTTVNSELRRLLGLLAEGLTLGEAAAELGLSRRTADRRLDAARRALDAERTAEALAKARLLGWFDAIGSAD